jgi:hypothetical protein
MWPDRREEDSYKKEPKPEKSNVWALDYIEAYEYAQHTETIAFWEGKPSVLQLYSVTANNDVAKELYKSGETKFYQLYELDRLEKGEG